MRQARGRSIAIALLLGVSTGAPLQAGATTATDPVVRQAAFGGAVAVFGDMVLVGEPQNSTRPGIVHVFRKAGGEWGSAVEIRASDAFNADGFGASIAVGDGMIAVGATAQNEGKGAVYLFRHEGQGRWTETARVTAEDAGEQDGFGGTVALVGDLLLIGAPVQGTQTGAVYVFRNVDGQWTQVDKLAGPADRAFFGVALAGENGNVLIGAPGVSEWTGAVHAYRVENGALVEAGRIDGAQKNDRFGLAVAMEGDEALIGAPTAGGGMGVVRVYSRAGAEWQHTGELAPEAEAGQTIFGNAVAFDGSRAIVGAPRAQGGVGAVHVFHRDGGAWTLASTLGLPAGERGDMLGGTVALGGDLAASGVVGDDHGNGSVLILERTGGEWARTGQVTGPDERLASITGGTIECKEEGKVAYFDCSQVDLVSFLSVEDLGGGRGVRLNDVWGWTDPETGKEYALVGRVDGTSFVDISDPARPVFVGDLPRTEGSPSSTWRDIKVYKNHAYVVADNAGQHGVQVFDLTLLRGYAGEPITFEPATIYDRVASAHNIVINEETGFAYSVGSSGGGETCGGGLHMIDIRDPKNPTFAGCFADPQTGRASTGYSHDAQCIVYRGPDEKYRDREICLGSNETALSIADVTDKQNPVAVARASYPNVGYSHQGWITEDHRFFYMNDELDEIQGSVPRTRTLIWDLTDLDDPQLAGEFLGTTEASDHNLYIVGDTMYQSHYQAGLRIVDISDPTNPVEVGFLDTVPTGENEPGFGGSWSNYPFFKSGVIVVTSGEEGLFMVRKKDAKSVL